jgi:hypothetical protein
MLASAAGAVVAASIASIFGVKGTIIGVAIGSAAATMGTAVVAQSIDRTHHAVRQAVVRAPDKSLLRRLGGTMAAGAVDETTPGANNALTEKTTSNEAQVDETAATGISPPELVTAETKIDSPGPPTAVLAEVETAEDAPRKVNWLLLAGTVALVFVFSLAVVTVVELIAGRPLADLFGGPTTGGGTTVQNIFGGSTKPHRTAPTSTTVPATSTSTTSAGSTTSTTGESNTTTTAPPTTTTSGPATSTTVGSSTTTTSG